MKVGLELHQRLKTHKLFCNCSSHMNTLASGRILRKQRAVAGELGEVDPAALHEYMRNRSFIYEIFPETTCLVELDEQPPFPMNREALEIVLEVCMLLNAKIVDEVEVMRKTVVDGSSVSGYQRTAIVGMDGKLETSRGEIQIQTICLEEESAGIVSDENGRITYRLDRMGIPLIEIATSPQIQDGEHAREVAEKIGKLLRATSRVQRGIGTVRQDLNVSIAGGERIEVKGAQELELIQTIIDREVSRQKVLIDLSKEIRERFSGKPKLNGKIIDVTEPFSKTNSNLLKRILLNGGRIFGVKFENFAGLLGRETCPGRRFGTELSDYAKANAGVSGIIHSDEVLDKYGISEVEKKELLALLGCEETDGFVLVAAEAEKAKKALDAVIMRAGILGVPKETRKSLGDGNTAYMRPLPGSSRMYPETDIPPLRITGKMFGAAKAKLPETPEKRLVRLEKILSKELANKISNSENFLLFERIVSLGVEPVLAATTLENTLVNLRRSGVRIEDVSEEKLIELFDLYSKGLFVKSAIDLLLSKITENPQRPIVQLVKENNLEKLSRRELAKMVKGRTLEEFMREYRLRADAKEVAEILKIK